MLSQAPAGPDDGSGWEAKAACARYDLTESDPWFPTAKDNTVEDRWAVARMICQACPVINECLDEVMTRESHWGAPSSRHGMFAGLTPEERANRQRRINNASKKSARAAREDRAS